MVHPVARGPVPAALKSHSPAHKHSWNCTFSQLLTCLEGVRVRSARKSKSQGWKVHKGGSRQEEAHQAGSALWT